MRQLHVQVLRQHAQRVLDLADEHQAFSPMAVEAERREGGEWVIVFLNLPNDRVGDFVGAVHREVEDAQFVIFPYGALPLQPPMHQVADQLRSVAPRSSLELVLSSLQSIGSWQGMLLYALYSGIVAAYGVIFNSAFLLVAAMLIAPMGAPAMVSVVGSAIGDWRMVGRGALRFFAAILVLMAAAAALGLAYRLGHSTAVMEQITSLSAWGVAVALVAGAAGAQSQVESERSSLVTGTATGFLIAAALSPTSAVLGLALVLQRWEYMGLMAFQLVLQYFAIVAGGWLSLSLYGVRAADPTLRRGSRPWRLGLAALLGAVVVSLLAWQVGRVPGFRKADVSIDATTLTSRAVEEVPQVRFVEADAHFTRPDLEWIPGETLLVRVVVLRQDGPLDADSLESLVRTRVRDRIESSVRGVLPLVNVTVLPGR